MGSRSVWRRTVKSELITSPSQEDSIVGDQGGKRKLFSTSMFRELMMESGTGDRHHRLYSNN
jgi:hypothetical protein